MTGNDIPCYACGEEVEHHVYLEPPRSRIGQLRGFGNAIVPQVGEAFIRAYMGA